MQSAYSQTLSKKYIDDWVIKCDTNIKPGKINLYSVDGHTYYFPKNSLKLDSALSIFKYSPLLDIFYFRTEEVFPTTEVPERVGIVIGIKGTQSRREKKQLFMEAMSKYARSELHFDHIRNYSKDPCTLN